LILECQLEILAPDFLIDPIDWTKSGGAGELFGLVKIRFEPADVGSETDAWLYLPYDSPHRANPYYAEILAPMLPIQEPSVCRLHFTAAKLTVCR
jgi:hypothetical protein